jgi:hypothetical protein
MAIKSEVRSELGRDVKYPCLMERIGAPFAIVMMSEAGVGMLVAGETKGGDKPGYYGRGDWKMENFRPFSGTVVLSNIVAA